MPETITATAAPSFEKFGLPISHARVHNGTVYVAGQAGLDPETNEVVDGGVRAETRQTMRNIEAILDAAGTSLDHLLDVTVYARDMADFNEINAAYAEFVDEPYPARSAVEVSDLALDFTVEIEAVAAIPE